MRNETIDETNNATIAKQYTDWHIKHGGFARDMTMRDYFAGLALQGFLAYAATTGKYVPPDDELARESYKMADVMLKERIK
jgi:hypothetical protein